MATKFTYDGEYTISFPEEDVFYEGLTYTELRRIKQSIENYLTSDELETILVEHNVTSWEGAKNIGLELSDVQLERPPYSIQLGDYFGMSITLSSRLTMISGELLNEICRALKNRFGSDSAQGNGAKFGREVVAYLV